MQDWMNQAQKNNIVIFDHGKCQLCGSNTSNGIKECIDLSNFIIHKLNHDDGIKYMNIFLCVDAHALQHSEIHGRWNNHYHLTRLNLILNEKIKWNYKYSPLLSEVVDFYKAKHLNERIIPPEVCNRGKITITDVDKAASEEEYVEEKYVELVNQWASGIFNSFVKGHDIAKTISDLFLERLK